MSVVTEDVPTWLGAPLAILIGNGGGPLLGAEKGEEEGTVENPNEEDMRGFFGKVRSAVFSAGKDFEQL